MSLLPSFHSAQQIAQTSPKLQSLEPAIAQFCQTHLGWQSDQSEPFHQLFQDLWLPLAVLIQQWQQQLDRPLIQGILGGQGIGKSTLAAIVSELLHQMGSTVCRLSIDDLYKTYSDRLKLQAFDPRIRWRGPPGTHDIELGITVLQHLRDRQPTHLPRFDKSACDGAGDRTDPEPVEAVDIIFFEGWFVGARPIDPQRFETAPSPIDSVINDSVINTVSDRTFARDMNEQLKTYLPLWDRLDRLIVLAPSDYRYSLNWRMAAEQRMRATGKSGMSDVEIVEFVTYFWRSLHPELFITPLMQPGSNADLVIQIDKNHFPETVYSPAQLG
jgi:D-glycerate 3-kinase